MILTLNPLPHIFAKTFQQERLVEDATLGHGPRLIDRVDHAQMWGEANGNSGYANAASDFESKNDLQKYNREAQVIQRVMNSSAGAAFLERVRKGQGTPQQIENWFLRNTGVPGMGRYFGGLNGG